METAEERILAALKAHSAGLGVREFARVIGVSAALWVRTRDGKLPLGLRMAQAARRFSDLEREVCFFLSHELPIRSTQRRKGNRAA